MHEITVKRSIAISTELDYARQRWEFVHGIGHPFRGTHIEREAEEFAYYLLVNGDEVLAERLGTLVEEAEHFALSMYVLWENTPQTWEEVRLW